MTTDLSAFDGYMACMSNVPVEDNPHDATTPEHLSWLLGWQEAERDIKIEATIIALRQALKSQVLALRDVLDTSELEEENPTTWWVSLLTGESRAALSEPDNLTVTYQNIVKNAIQFVLDDSIDINHIGATLDESKLDGYIALKKSVLDLLAQKQ